MYRSGEHSHVAHGRLRKIAAAEEAENILATHLATVELVALSQERGNQRSMKRTHRSPFTVGAREAFLKEVRMDKEKNKLVPKIGSLVGNSTKYTPPETVEAIQRSGSTHGALDRFAGQYSALIESSGSEIAPLRIDEMGGSILNFLRIANAQQCKL